MITFDDFEAVKRIVHKSQRERDKALGVLQELNNRLEKEFQCRTLQEAKALLEEQLKKEKSLLKLWNDKLGKFKEKWKDELKELEEESE